MLIERSKKSKKGCANVCFLTQSGMRKIDGEFIGRARLFDYGSQDARPCRSAEPVSRR